MGSAGKPVTLNRLACPELVKGKDGMSFLGLRSTFSKFPLRGGEFPLTGAGFFLKLGTLGPTETLNPNTIPEWLNGRAVGC